MPVMDQKLRVLYLMDIMLQRTDEQHMLNATEICRILDQEYAISTDRRTIYSDMEVLLAYGLDIQQKKGKNPGYYIGTREFELPELKLLVDAVQSSNFITKKKSWELIKKLEKLCSKMNARLLEKQVIVTNRIKTENEMIYYNVDDIHTAIYENKEIAFQYAEWTMQKKLHLKKEGKRYIVSPWVLTWNNENYYLLAYDDRKGGMKHYRVDKMLHITVLETLRKGKDAFSDFDLASFSKKTFGMYGGIDAEVSLLCHKSLAGVIIDRFGHDIWMRVVDEEYFVTRVLVSVSPQFFGWLTGLGERVQIKEPPYIRKQYKDYLQNIIGKY